jgi:hypothetical protein
MIYGGVTGKQAAGNESGELIPNQENLTADEDDERR